MAEIKADHRPQTPSSGLGVAGKFELRQGHGRVLVHRIQVDEDQIRLGDGRATSDLVAASGVQQGKD